MALPALLLLRLLTRLSTNMSRLTGADVAVLSISGWSFELKSMADDSKSNTLVQTYFFPVDIVYLHSEHEWYICGTLGDVQCV